MYLVSIKIQQYHQIEESFTVWEILVKVPGFLGVSKQPRIKKYQENVGVILF